MSKQKITIYHSPDADDAFMFYGLTSGAVNDPDFEFDHDLSDIQTLNERAIKGEIDVTAVSVHAFAYLKNQYVILTCGASMGGKDYGPRLIAGKDFNGKISDIKSIAIPGQHTSATLALKIMLTEIGIEAELINYDFKDVFRAISAGEVEAGVIIHEGQLTYQNHSFKLIEDLGEWWFKKTALPLPLGVNVAARILGTKAIQASANALYRSISYSLASRQEALDYAMQYARGIERSDADTFVGMYVNNLTLNLETNGKKAIELFLQKAADYKLIPEMPEIEFVDPAIHHL